MSAASPPIEQTIRNGLTTGFQKLTNMMQDDEPEQQTFASEKPDTLQEPEQERERDEPANKSTAFTSATVATLM